MMLFLYSAKNRLKIIFLIFLILYLSLAINTKYTFNKFNMNSESQTSMEAAIKNFAMNLADTNLLKITNNFSSEGHTKKIKKQLFNKYIKSGIGLNSENGNIISGSVMISESGELSFSKEFINEENYNLFKGRKLIARARYTKSLGQIGWSRLFVETFDNTSPEIQSWAAGFLEGKLCAKEILDFYKNLVGIHSKETSYLNDVFQYYKKVEKSIRYRTSKPVLANVNKGADLEYWISVAMTQAQTDGLLAGYNTIMKNDLLDVSQIYFLNADGEVPELLSVFKFKKDSNKNLNNYSFKERSNKGFMQPKQQKFSKEFLKYYFDSSDPEFIWNNLMTHSHCSAIIKVLRDENDSIKDVLIGHTTWDSYAEMHRVYKIYKFSYTLYDTEKKQSHIAFSSYPGTLTSTDDFYTINNKLVVLETTLEILDRSLYETQIPDADEYVPNYIRISVANRMAQSGNHWTEIFKQNNGGTYNSQWMIFDFDKMKALGEQVKYSEENYGSIFQKIQESDRVESSTYENMNPPTNFVDFSFKERLGSKSNQLAYGFFYLLEQIPGHIEVRDMTNHLAQRGFWASYNRPYFKKIYKDAGYYDMMNNYGKIYSYEDNPRANVILSQINSVQNIEGLKLLMRRNLNINNTDRINTVSPRYDLSAKIEYRRPAGGIDTKIISLGLLNEGALEAISGPSTQDNASPFNWNDWKDEPHYGLPIYWNFDWVKFDDIFVKND